jgi:hypothetical protein
VRPEEGTTTEFIADQLWLDAAIQEKIGDQVKEKDISVLTDCLAKTPTTSLMLRMMVTMK